MNHQEGLSLELKDVGRRDAGTYVCTASNGIGKEAHAEIKVDITCKCRILHFSYCKNSVTYAIVVGNTHATFDRHKFASIDRAALMLQTVGDNTEEKLAQTFSLFCHA